MPETQSLVSSSQSAVEHTKTRATDHDLISGFYRQEFLWRKTLSLFRILSRFSDPRDNVRSMKNYKWGVR